MVSLLKQYGFMATGETPITTFKLCHVNSPEDRLWRLPQSKNSKRNQRLSRVLQCGQAFAIKPELTNLPNDLANLTYPTDPTVLTL